MVEVEDPGGSSTLSTPSELGNTFTFKNQAQHRKNWVLMQQFYAAPFTYAYLPTKQNYPAI